MNKEVENFNTDKIYFQNRHLMNNHGEQKLIQTNKIKFDYTEKPFDKKFQDEQKNAVNMNTWYPNTWIESIEEDGTVIENSREKVTGENPILFDSNVRNSFEFNETKPAKFDGTIDPADFNGTGKSIKEIYDNMLVDYKKTVPKKESKENDSTVKAASGLSYFSSDTWLYDNEKPENGGMMEGGIYAADLSSIGNVAVF
jgi:hypothetical protein